MKTHKYKGKEYSVRELKELYKSKFNEDISLEKLRYRLNNRNTVEEAFDFVSKCESPGGHLCPDGKRRTHRQISAHLGLGFHCWYQRYRTYGVEKAWFMQGYKKRVPKKEPKPYKMVCRIPEPTSLELELYK